MNDALRSADDEAERKDELVIVGELQQERRTSTMAGRVRVLRQDGSSAPLAAVGTLSLVRPWRRTSTNSTGLRSPVDRDGVTLVAGNAFGTTFIAVRRLGLAMTTEERVTTFKDVSQCLSHVKQVGQPPSPVL